MRIGVDATSWSNRRGYGRFTRGLLGALLPLDKANRYLLIADRDAAAGLPHSPNAELIVVDTSESPVRAARAGSRRGIPDLVRMAAAVRRAELEILFFPTVYTYFPVPTKAKVVVGIHDTIAEDFPRLVFPDAKGRLLWRAKSRLARAQADVVMTVSEFAKRRIVERFGLAATDVWVIDEAPDPIFRPGTSDKASAALEQAGIGPGELFVAYVGGINPHKNLESLARALASVRQQPGLGGTKLLIVGDLQDFFTPGLAPLRRVINELHLEEAVSFTGYLSDAELAAVLSAAALAALPSMAEGFGLPAIEAAACGTPVVATRNSPLPEILEGGGFFIDPRNGEELAGAIARLLDDEDLRRTMGRIALERAGRLTWERSAGQMLSLFEALEARR